MEDQGAPAAPECRNLEETARFFGVTTPTVRTWIKDGCPVAEGGSNGVPYKLDLRAVHNWRIERDDADKAEAERRAQAEAQLRLELLGDDAIDDAAGGPLTPKQRADFLSAELNRIRLAKERGELVNAEEMRLRLAESLALVRERLRALPDQFSRRFGLSDQVAAAMAEEIDSLLEDLANTLEAIGQDQPAKAA